MSRYLLALHEVISKSALIVIMRGFFILAMLILTTQTIHFGYLRWVYTPTVIVDPLEENPAPITPEAKSLDDLVKRHNEALARIKSYESNKSNPVINRTDRREIEPYRTEILLSADITSWEKQDKRILAVRYYCIWGVAFVLFGILAFKKVDEYLGLSLLLAGFCELIGYTGSLIYNPDLGYTRLLNAQILYSLASIVVLLLTAFYLGIIGRQT